MFSTATHPQRRHRRSFKFPWGVVGIIFGVAVVLLGLVGQAKAYSTEVRYEGCVVESTTHFAYDPATKQTVKRVVTENCGTFNIAPDFARGQYFPQMNEMVNSLEVGQAYTFTTVGYSNPVLSAFPNIIKIEQ